MLILLPPSEGKSDPAPRGRPVDVDALSFASDDELTRTRRRVLDAFTSVSAAPDAASRLGFGASLAPEVARRSQAYAVWAPRGEQAARTASARVWQDGPGGRTVVSHLAKQTRGEITRDLLLHGAEPRTVPQLAEELRPRWRVEPAPPPRPGGTWTLDVVVDPPVEGEAS